VSGRARERKNKSAKKRKEPYLVVWRGKTQYEKRTSIKKRMGKSGQEKSETGADTSPIGCEKKRRRQGRTGKSLMKKKRKKKKPKKGT